jgi:Chromo (CHRromatin Organisation MOdifier) domain
MEEHRLNFAKLPLELIEEHEEYKVEQVLALRLFGCWKKLQYLIRWKGYSHTHDSWTSADDIHAPDLIQAFHRSNPQVPRLVLHIRRLETTEGPQLMSSHTPLHPTTSYLQPFVTGNGTQHVQRTGTTPWPQDEYELSWMGNDPPHFICIVCNADAPLSGTNALAIPTATHDDDESTMPTVYTSGRAMGGDRAVELHEVGADSLAARHPDPWPILPARSNVS